MTLRTTTRTALVTASLAASLMLGGVALADGFYADGSDSGNGAAATQTQQGGGRGNGAQAGKGSQGNGAKLVTASNGSVSFQVPAGWDHATYSDDGITYDIYTGPNAVFQVATVTGDRIPSADGDLRFTAEFVEELAGDVDVDEDSLLRGEVQDRTVDGVTIRDISYTERDDGREMQGYVSIVYGAGSVTVAVSAFPADCGVEEMGACADIHLSLTPDASAADDGGFLAEDPSKGDVAVGDTLRYEDFDYTVSDDPSTYTTVDVNGTALIGVPVTVKNYEDEPERLDVREITLSGPSGKAQVTDASVYPEDSIYSVGRIAPGEEVTAMLYFVDEGAGDYMVTFADDDRDDRYDEDMMTIVIEM